LPSKIRTTTDTAVVWEATPIDATGIGLALLRVGILTLVATLLSEAHLQARITAAAAPAGDD
jgi:hypothetical protein